MGWIDILFVAIFIFVLVSIFFRNKKGLPTNWPVVGMLPALLKNVHRLHDYFAEVLEKSPLTFHFKGPAFTNMDLLATGDPATVHYVMSKNFGNYPKGTKFNENFDVLGDGIFNADFKLWEYHRKMAQSFLGHPKFHHFLVKKIWEKIDNGLIPVLDYVCDQGVEVDLQDLFERFTFDMICSIIMDYDPKSLCTTFPRIPASKALDDIEEVILHRHVIPSCVWKFQRWLDIGLEKKHRKAWETLDDFVYENIDRKREQVTEKKSHTKEDLIGVDLLTLYMDGNGSLTKDTKSADKFLRDTILNFFIAGRDTTSTALSWFFYLLSCHPQVLSKIKEELDSKVGQLLPKFFEETNDKLVYLHGALCEALRLYPPVAFEAKLPNKPDILPSGHKVDQNTQIVFSLYAMGRMKSIWGDDCYEFKPERWISDSGKIKHEPSYKFLAFNAGPRTCVGKNMAFTQMKAVAATIIQNYRLEAVKGHPVVPDVSIILHMKYGFKVKVFSSK